MILNHPDKGLLTACRPVDAAYIESGELARLLETMLAHMERSRGIGIAANQIGSDRQVAIVTLPRGEPYIMVNPEILKAAGSVKCEERCLSVRENGQTVPYTVTRPKRLRVRFLEPTAPGWMSEARTINVAGLLAQCIAHELDHLQGVTIIERSQGEAA